MIQVISGLKESGIFNKIHVYNLISKEHVVTRGYILNSQELHMRIFLKNVYIERMQSPSLFNSPSENANYLGVMPLQWQNEDKDQKSTLDF